MEVDKKRGGMEVQGKEPYMIVNFFVRAVIGFAAIFFVNQFLAEEGISVSVGLNPITFVTSGTLGVPGVALLYGITFYQGM